MSFENPSANTPETKKHSAEELAKMQEQVKFNMGSIRKGVENGIMEKMAGRGRGLGTSPLESGASYKVFRSGFGGFEVKIDETPESGLSDKTKINKMAIEQRQDFSWIKEPKQGDVVGSIEKVTIGNGGEAAYTRSERIATDAKDKFDEREVESASLSNHPESAKDPEKVIEKINAYKEISMLNPDVEKLEKGK